LNLFYYTSSFAIIGGAARREVLDYKDSPKVCCDDEHFFRRRARL